MKLFIATSFLFLCTHCLGMEPYQLRLDIQNDNQDPVEIKRWADTVVTCIERRKKNQLAQLFERAPILRSRHALNTNIFEEIKAHRDEQLDAIQSDCGSKRIWNKCRAIIIDMGLPIAALGVGLAEGIIADEPVIIALSSIYFVLSLESAIRQAHTHWTLKEYEGKVEEFDVWLQLMQGLQRLEEKGEDARLQQEEAVKLE